MNLKLTSGFTEPSYRYRDPKPLSVAGKICKIGFGEWLGCCMEGVRCGDMWYRASEERARTWHASVTYCRATKNFGAADFRSAGLDAGEEREKVV